MTQRTRSGASPQNNSLTGLEYSTLRQEILQRMAARHQIEGVTLVAFGVILTIALGDKGTVTTLLAYPILVLFLASRWAHQGTRFLRVARYVRQRIEANPNYGLGWETYLYKSEPAPFSPIRSLGSLSAPGMFLSSQALMIIIRAMSNPPFTSLDTLLVIVDGISVAITAFVLWRYSQTLR